MSAIYEQNNHSDIRIWTQKYKNLHNLPHWHLETELLVCTLGSVRLNIDGHAHILKCGEASMLPSGCVHFIESDPDAQLLIAKFDLPELKPILSVSRLSSPVFKDAYQAADCLENIRLELKQKSAFYQLKTDSLLIHLIIEIFRHEPSEPVVNNSATMVRYKKLLSEIRERFEFITFSEAVDYMNMSEAYFSRFFKKVSGMTFSNYLNLVKIDQAVESIHANPKISITTLMLESGFNTLRNFQRVFKSITGYSPRHLPPDYHLAIRTFSSRDTEFDPTLPSSVIL